MRHSLLLLCVAAGCAAPLSYDRVLQKSTHNSYERDESLFDQLVYDRVRSLELDVQLTRGLAVYHRESGADPNHTSCRTLSECIDVLATFHRATPLHEVVTVWIEPSDYETPPVNDGQYTASGPVPVAALEAAVGRLPLFTPMDYIASCQRKTGATYKTLQAAAAACGFPSTDELRSKFIFVLMWGNDGEERALTGYLGPSDPVQRKLFVAPKLSNEKSICSNCAVFYDDGDALGFYGTGRVTRKTIDHVSCSDPSSAAWTTAEGHRQQHLGTDCVSYLSTPWAVTHNAHGWPFECVPRTRSECTTKSEETDLIGVEATSYDIDGRSDDFVFAYESPTPLRASSWSAFVSTPSSNLNPWSKGCLMARQSSSADSPYFAVCRPGDRHNVRVQYRAHPGGDTTTVELDVNPEKTAAYVQLKVAPDRGRTCFAGLDSPDGVSWRTVPQATVCLDGSSFGLQGLAVSSHGDPFVRMLFGNVRRTVDRTETAYRASMFPTVQWIGRGPAGRGRAYDGPIAP